MLDFDELVIWIVSSILLGLIMSLKIINGVLHIENDFFLMTAFAFVMLFVFIASQKLVAWWLDCKTKIKWLGFRQFWFEERYRLRWYFPLWIVLPILLSLITANFIKWLAILNFDIEPKESRVRRRWYDLTEMDVAKIAIAGPVACIALAILLKAFNLGQFAVYPAWLAFLSLLPIGQGLKVLMGSRNLWVFLTAISLFVLLLINVTGLFAIIITTLLFAIAIIVAYYVMWER